MSIFNHDDDDEREDWAPVSVTRFVAFTVGLGVFVGMLLLGEPGYCVFIDGANLLFHEAGHPVFGLLGEKVEPYGGTLGQFVFPIIVIVGFWRKGAPISFAAGWVWFFENFFNVARYMADARVQELPLVGGGEHDWTYIFATWGILDLDTTIAHWVNVAGWAGIAAAWLWVAWRVAATRRAAQAG